MAFWAMPPVDKTVDILLQVLITFRPYNKSTDTYIFLQVIHSSNYQARAGLSGKRFAQLLGYLMDLLAELRVLFQASLNRLVRVKDRSVGLAEGLGYVRQ